MEKQIANFKWEYLGDGRYRQTMSLIEGEEFKSVPLKAYRFTFELSKEKYCTGYRTVDEKILCPNKSTVQRKYDTQCFYCEKKQGFKSAFFFGEEPNEIAKQYLGQPHYVYLAFFPPMTVKVGTASKGRRNVRPIEQDALAFMYIAEVPNGFEVQELEKAISKSFEITEFVRAKDKLKHLSERINTKSAEDILRARLAKIHSYFENNDKFKKWLFPQDEVSFNNLTELPQLFYPEKEVNLLEDEYNLVGEFRGLRGRYVIFENDNRLYAFDERWLIGRKIESYTDDWRYAAVNGNEQIGLL